MFAAIGLACIVFPALAQSPSATVLPPLEVQGAGERTSSAQAARAASEQDFSGAEVNAQPAARTGEVLEVTPGLIVTQHSGEGKANQYFLRGFNLDHGTDLSLKVDGMPVNLSLIHISEPTRPY